MGQSGKDKNAQDQIVKQGFVAQDHLTSIASITVPLEKSLGSSTDLRIHYGKDSTAKRVPTDAFSSRNGFVGGLEWVPHRILVNTAANGNDFKYTIDGTLRWTLLGTTVYHQKKRYESSPD